MPRFLYTIIFLAVISLLAFFYLLSFTSPLKEIPTGSPPTLNTKNITLFLFTFSLLLFTLVSLLFYALYSPISPSYDRRTTMRKSLRQSFLISLGVVGGLLMKLTATLNLLTVPLLLAVLLAIELSFRTRS